MKWQRTRAARDRRAAGAAAGRRVAVGLLVAAMVALLAGSGPADAQQRSVVVVGDSIILGAQTAMVGAFTDLGWAVDFDAAVSRSTSQGADAINSHWMELTDTLVVGLGANDAGNTGAFRQKVEQILSATAGVPHVYWLTISEVRDYYPAANQAVREAAAGYPNVTVLDWNAVTAGSSGLTSGDGLHLTGAGAAAMTELVVSAVLQAEWAALAPPPPAPAETAPPATDAPLLVPPPTDVVGEVPTTVPEVTTTLAPTTTSVSTTTTVAAARRVVAPADRAAATVPADRGVSVGSTLGGGFAVVVALLAMAGAGVGGWALVATRDRPGDSSSEPDPPT